MDYQFPQVPYKVYSKTFLKDVHLVFKFATVHPDEILIADAKRYFETSFNGVILNDVDLSEGLNIKSTDELVWFDFRWDKLTICMKSPMYKSFELTLVVMEFALEFFKVIGITTVANLIFYKFNELSYNVERNVEVSSIMKQIFSNDLLKKMTPEDEVAQKNLSRWEKQISYSDDESQFVIEFGFSRTTKESNRGTLTLKTQIESKDVVHVNDIENTLRKFNQVLDNAFHWCILSEIIKEME